MSPAVQSDASWGAILVPHLLIIPIWRRGRLLPLLYRDCIPIFIDYNYRLINGPRIWIGIGTGIICLAPTFPKALAVP